MRTFLAALRRSVVLTVLFTIVAGFAYPLILTGVVGRLFPVQAEGSLLVRHGRVVGSTLIGQPFEDPKDFWGRPSATTPFPDNAANSSGSNLGPLNPDLAAAVKARVAALRAAGGDPSAPVPMDLVTTSASGLDPHISPAAAFYQVGRVARARRLPVSRVRALVAAHVEGRTLGVFGEPRVNVLVLNLDLAALGR